MSIMSDKRSIEEVLPMSEETWEVYRQNDRATEETLRGRRRDERLTKEQAAKRIQELARTEAYHRGPGVKFEDIAKHCPPWWPARFIAEQCELAGFPVWTSVPDEALKP